MGKQEQSFAFTDSDRQPESGKEQRKIVSLSSATKLTPNPTNDDTPQVATQVETKAKVIKAVALTPAQKYDEPIKVAKAVALTPTQKPDEPVKVAKAVALNPEPKPDEPVKVAKAVALKPEPKPDEPVKVAKAVALKPALQTDNSNAPGETINTSKETEETGPTRKLPIPINSEKGVQLTDENIAQRLNNSEKVPPAETGPTQKIAIPPSENVGINLNEDSNKSTKHAPTKKKKSNNLPKETINQKLKIKFGKYLQEARISKELSLSEVENITKIRKCYVEALESENFSKLPPIVYICAYVKTLCLTYEIDNAMQELILSELKQLRPTHLSDETIHNLNIDCEIDEAEEHKLKLIVTSIIAAIIIICLVIAVSIWLINSDKPPQPQPTTTLGTKFARSDLRELSPPQSIKMTILKPNF